jgi:xanthosine utilization system XapX-like protein
MGFVNFMLSIAGRVLRVVAGVVIIWFALHSLQSPWSFVVAAIGLVPIAAGLFNFCLLGPLFSVDLLGRPRTNSAP